MKHPAPSAGDHLRPRLLSMAPSSALQWFILLLPAAVLLAYFLTAFPPQSVSLTNYPSLATLPAHSPSWEIYPEDFYAGGAYVRLPYGSVRYWLIGPENGQRIVLIHGLSVPAIIWKDVGPYLATNGFRVLLYDLYGRGYSDAPQTTYDTTLYTTQLALLMQYVGWDKAHITGVSMGGGIAAAFVAQFPHLATNRTALIASTGLVDSSELSRTSKFLSSPLMQSSPLYILSLYLQHLANSREISDDPIADLIRIQSAYLPGFNPAVASSIRDGPIRSLAPAFTALGRRTRKQGGRVLLIWGTADSVVPFSNAARVCALVPSAELLTVPEGGHDLTISHAQEVGRALADFFRKE
ncbi:alpha/beta-hydrolase [Amylocystis lapponica]|nr:alpha/beta-hydrolase [Amylocystis lapponica]